MAAGFQSAEPRDANAQKLQQEIKNIGIEQAVSEYTGLDADSPIAKRVIEYYHQSAR